MKKHIVESLGMVVRKTIVRVTLASFLVFSVLPGHTQDQVKPGIPVEIRYLGTIDNLPVFQIEFANENNEVFTISIKDEDGNVLYKENVKEKKFLRKFKWDKTNLDESKLTFTLTGLKDAKTQVFEINTNTRVIADVVITRL